VDGHSSLTDWRNQTVIIDYAPSFGGLYPPNSLHFSPVVLGHLIKLIAQNKIASKNRQWQINKGWKTLTRGIMARTLADCGAFS